MQIDLTEKFSTPLFEEICKKNRHSFVDFVDSISANNRETVEWWCSQVASRNPYANELYWDYCKLKYLAALLQKNRSKNRTFVVHAGYPALARAMAEELHKINMRGSVWFAGKPLYFIDEYVSRRKVSFWKKPIIAVERILRSILQYRAYFKQMRGVLKKFANTARIEADPIIDPESTVFVDIFLRYDSIKSGKYNDIYYGRMMECLKSGNINATYLPYLYDLDQIEQVVKAIRKSGYSCVLFTQYISRVDYLLAIMFPILAVQRVKLNQSDLLHNLVRHYLLTERFGINTIISYLMYLFIKRISFQGVQFGVYINWFENQIQDHVINFAIRKYMPKTIIYGMQQYTSPYEYLSNSPSCGEYTAEVIPHVVLVTGEALIPVRREFCEKIDAFSIPAFRFEYMHSGNVLSTVEKTEKAGFNVMLAWPMFGFDEVFLRVLRAIKAGSDIQSDIKVFVKPHPSNIETVKSLLRDNSEHLCELEIVEGTFAAAHCLADVLIVNLSNIAMEAVCLGIPVVLITDKKNYPCNSIYDFVDESLYYKVITPESVVMAINKLRNFALPKKHEVESLRENVFSAVNEDSVSNFLEMIYEANRQNPE